jgi:O-antigen/teichoic acid export membrane protein
MNIKKVLNFSIGPIGAAFLGVLTIPILAWSFSVADIGRFGILQLILSFSCILFTLGLDQAYVREYHEVSDRGVLFKTALIPSIAFFGIIVFFLLFKAEIISSWAYQVPSLFLSIMTIICIFLNILLRYFSLTIRMQERGILYSISQVFPKLILLIMVITLYFSNRNNFDFYYLIIIQFFSLFLVSLIFIYFIKEDFLSAFTKKTDLKLLKKLFKFGFPLVLSGLVFWLMQSASRIVLLKISTLEEVGIFSIAISIAAGFSIFASIFNTLWAPAIYKLVKAGKGVSEVEIASEYIAFLISMIIGFITILMPLIPFFLPKNYEGIEYLVLLCIMQPLFYVLSEATAVGLLIRKTNYTIFISIVGLMVNFILLMALVPAYGALGAAISVSLSFWFFFILRTEFACAIWENITRKKVYISTSISLLFVVINSFLKIDYFISITGVLILFIINIFIFKDLARKLLKSTLASLRFL